jgi:transitional endoplasmic reticulum ATPase
MDEILNLIDGIDTKNSNIIVVLTTNDLDAINPAMIRPGRLDAVIDVTPPDAQAVEKLLRLYGGTAINPETDLTDAGRVLAGNIPAVIAEVVKRAKLAELRRLQPGQKVSQLSQDAIVEASKTMHAQVALLKRLSEPKETKPTITDLVIEAVQDVTHDHLEKTNKRVEDICARLSC